VAWYDPCIERVPGVQGGAPVIRGTRTPVRTIVGYAHAYQGDRNEVRTAPPYLSPEQIEAAVAYYRDHQAEIDRDGARHVDALLQCPTVRFA
jgi:uncharacterized protein (DUF433 family)